MRYRVLPLFLAAGLALTACSSGSADGDATATATATATSSATSVPAEIAGSDAGFTASGAFGEKPTLTFDGDTPPEGLQVETVSAGDGETVEAGDYVVANYLGQIWNTETVFDNSYDRGAPSGFSLDQVVTGWTVGLVGQTVGSRVLLTIPADLGYGPSGGSSDGSISATDTIVFVVDIVGSFNPEASGQADATVTGADVPVTVTGDLGAPISAVTITAGAAEPTETVTTVLATGTGAPLAATDQVLMQYTLTTWDGTGTETTWPSLSGYGMFLTTPAAPFDGLVGVPVGSRVLIQMPAEVAGGTSSLAVVIDVVAAVTP